MDNLDTIYLVQKNTVGSYYYGCRRAHRKGLFRQSFLCYNIPRKVPVTLRGLVRFLFICVIIKVHHRQRAMS
nr:MAG TPA: hypothetical protein [Caudoviricetes sp.]